jgi:hypothetical protein
LNQRFIVCLGCCACVKMGEGLFSVDQVLDFWGPGGGSRSQSVGAHSSLSCYEERQFGGGEALPDLKISSQAENEKLDLKGRGLYAGEAILTGRGRRLSGTQFRVRDTQTSEAQGHVNATDLPLLTMPTSAQSAIKHAPCGCS